MQLDTCRRHRRPDTARGRRARRDSTIYATLCPKLGMRVAVKVYDKAALSPSKLRAVKREAAMMIMMQRKRRAPACFSCMLCHSKGI